MEVLTTVFHRGPRHVTSLNGQMSVLIYSGSKFFTIHFYFFTSFQLFQLDFRAQSTENDGSLLALCALYLADAVGALDANAIASS